PRQRAWSGWSGSPQPTAVPGSFHGQGKRPYSIAPPWTLSHLGSSANTLGGPGDLLPRLVGQGGYNDGLRELTSLATNTSTWVHPFWDSSQVVHCELHQTR